MFKSMKQQSKMFSRCYGKFRKRGEILSIIYICMNLAKNGARNRPCCFARAMAAVVIILYCMLSETDQADNSSTCVVCIQVSSIPILSHNPQPRTALFTWTRISLKLSKFPDKMRPLFGFEYLYNGLR